MADTKLPPNLLTQPPAALPTDEKPKGAGKKVVNAVGTVAKDVVKPFGWIVMGTHGNPIKGIVNAAGILEGGFSALIDPPGIKGEPYPVGNWRTDAKVVSPYLMRGPRIDSPEGYKQLKAMGFNGMFDLRLEGADDAERGAKAAHLNTGHAAILDNTPPDRKQILRFLKFVTDPANVPCYVHCEAGKGRTGVMSAAYRMAAQGLDPGRALAEAKKLGCAMPDQQQAILNLGKDLGWVQGKDGKWSLSGKSKVPGFPLNPSIPIPPGSLQLP